MPEWGQRRTSFGAGAADYDAYRPGYPADGLRWLLGDAPRRVVDLGAGTGRLAVALAALGHDVVAVEPDDRMRAIAAGHVEALAGSAEAIPLPDASADAVLAAQAWHWFDHERALAEIGRVLRPGGMLGLVWNMRETREPWVARLGEIAGGEDHSFDDTAPVQFHVGDGWRTEGRWFHHTQTLDRDGLLGLARSWSYVALREDREAVLEQIGRLADGLGERFELPYGCLVVRAVMIAP